MMEEYEKFSKISYFREGVVLIYLINAPSDFRGGIAICNAKIEVINGRAFVIGSVPNMLNDWSAGQKIGVAFDQVAHFIVFSSEQEFIERSTSWNV